MMDSQEFVRLCQACGYASKRTATQYVEGKTDLGPADFEAVHTLNERRNDIANGVLEWNRSNGCHGDDLLDLLGRTPNDWNRTFDASRGVKL